jgi:hypothetical protein
MDFILEGLPDLIKYKVGKFPLAKEIWDKLHNLYFKEYHFITEPKHDIYNK